MNAIIELWIGLWWTMFAWAAPWALVGLTCAVIALAWMGIQAVCRGATRLFARKREAGIKVTSPAVGVLALVPTAPGARIPDGTRAEDWSEGRTWANGLGPVPRDAFGRAIEAAGLQGAISLQTAQAAYQRNLVRGLTPAPVVSHRDMVPDGFGRFRHAERGTLSGETGPEAQWQGRGNGFSDPDHVARLDAAFARGVIHTGGRVATVLALVAAIALSACSSQSGSQVATVSASEAALAAAGHVIVACYAVPACNSVAPKPQIKAAFDQAYAAVTTAQTTADAGGTPDMTATTTAISALQSLLATLPTAPAAS